VIVLIAEDDDGHATLIERNLRRAGLLNEFIRFKDGQETLDFLFEKGKGPHRKDEMAYLMLLDIRMPKVDGVEVLRQVKAEIGLKKLPIIMVTTTDDPREVALCHELGCSSYITKPIDYGNFMEAVRQLGLFLLVVEVPVINGKNGR
jgi:CheY-like chemotaxis protein